MSISAGCYRMILLWLIEDHRKKYRSPQIIRIRLCFGSLLLSLFPMNKYTSVNANQIFQIMNILVLKALWLGSSKQLSFFAYSWSIAREACKEKAHPFDCFWYPYVHKNTCNNKKYGLFQFLWNRDKTVYGIYRIWFRKKPQSLTMIYSAYLSLFWKKL